VKPPLITGDAIRAIAQAMADVQITSSAPAVPGPPKITVPPWDHFTGFEFVHTNMPPPKPYTPPRGREPFRKFFR